ncbi:MAG: ribosomal protein S18-alanine N-acetyltransferase [Chloroflexi bacterium]|nr:ribosomal protein S18-alanine N-acetyltransferase [Chloroflexota bacterium]
MSILEHEQSKTSSMPYALRPMLPEDTQAVAEIEREAFPTTWPPTPLRKELHNRLARYLVSYRPSDEVGAEAVAPPQAAPPPSSLLARLLQGLWPRAGRQHMDGDGVRQIIPGYVGMWFMADEAHITAIAVREQYRGRGIGELLLMGCVELSILRRAREVTLEVRVTNDLAQTLYKKYGFEIVGARKRYYTDNNEDAYIMTTGAIQSAEYQRELSAKVEEHARRWGESERMLTS